MCYFVLFWVNRSRKMATTLAVNREKFSSVGPPQFEESFGFCNRLFKLSLQSWKKKIINIFYTRGTTPRVPPMMRTLSINGVKHHLPK